jgi:ankyrin repeat protein
LHWACSGGCLAFVQLAISEDQDLLKKADDSGFTPLMIAVSAGRIEVAKYLLSFTQCDVNHKLVFL